MISLLLLARSLAALLFFGGRERDATDLASGVYLYKLAAGKFLDVKKMLLIK